MKKKLKNLLLNLLPQKKKVVVQMNFSDWQREFQPINPLNNSPEEALYGCVFETFGADLQFVKYSELRKIWTLVEEDGTLYIENGFHIVNRLGYLITVKRWNADYVVRLDGND